jgi:hypothetical protein
LLKHFPRFSRSFPEFEAKFHTHALFLEAIHFHCLKKSQAGRFSGCSSLTGSERVMRQEALCYQRLPLVSVTSRSVFRSLFQALRAQSGLFFNIPCRLPTTAPHPSASYLLVPRLYSRAGAGLCNVDSC